MSLPRPRKRGADAEIRQNDRALKQGYQESALGGEANAAESEEQARNADLPAR